MKFVRHRPPTVSGQVVPGIVYFIKFKVLGDLIKITLFPLRLLYAASLKTWDEGRTCELADPH